jgi:hypothetical protein
VVDEKILVLEQAKRCRRLADAIDDEDFARKLMTMTQEYEEKAATVLSPPLVPMEYRTSKKTSSGALTDFGRKQVGQKAATRNIYLEAER